MTLTFILICAGASLPFMWLVPGRWRPWGLLAASLIAMGWLQGDTAGGSGMFLLPAATLILTLAVWWIVQPEASPYTRENRLALALMGSALALIWLAMPGNDRPGLDAVLPGLGLACAAAVSVSYMLPAKTQNEQAEPYRRAAVLLITLITLVLLVMKSATLTRFFSQWLGNTSPADPAITLSWLGFSYFAFRLISVLIDFRGGRLLQDGLPLRDMAIYVLFFPALTAGPIDRVQRFIPELNETNPLDASRLVEGSARIAAGVAKKFIIADSLALVAMNPILINQTDSTPGLWLLLYLYTFQIFLDFSGYSDVAIGLGRLYGITLPENFDRPYLQPNVQQFWQRWHITLSTWFRVYFFTPLTRALIRSPRRYSPTLIVLVAQISTMFLIGMWHGVTFNFALWGLWHGVGLFIHKQITDHTRVWYLRVRQHTWPRRLITAGSVFVTFHFVALGWVFFALPTPGDSLDMLARLFGLGG